MPTDKIVISGTLYGQLIQNRLYMRSEEFQEPDEVAAHIRNTWVNTVKFLQHSGLRYTQIQVTRIDEGPNLQATLLLNVTGGQSQETQETSFAAGVLQFKTGLAGRQFRGRYYLAAIRMGATQFGQFTESEFNLWTTQINILKGAFIGPQGGSTGLQLIIRHSGQIADTPVTDIGLRPTLGVQRRRNIGVGA